MDVKRQIEYWIDSAESDLTSASLLIDNDRILHGLFFCHLCIEKALKAHVVRCSLETPQKIHKLSYLLSITDLEMSEEDKDFCAILMTYLLEGRYPDYNPFVPSKEQTELYLHKTKTLFQWLKKKL